MRKCVKCIDDPGEFTWITGKKYCKPCSSDVECSNCKLELYTTIKTEGESLEVDYQSDTPITDETKIAWINMGLYTTLYGYEKPKDKSVYNFFQYANSTGKKKGKVQVYCFGCLQLLAKKIMFGITHKKISEPKKKMTSIGIGKKCKINIDIFENILSYLTMPKHVGVIEGVCKGWKRYMRSYNNFGWMRELTIETKDHYPTEDPIHKEEEQQEAKEWDDLKLLNILKHFGKYKQFNGFTGLKGIVMDTGMTEITNYGILCLVELIRGSTIEKIKLDNMTKVRWLGLHRLLQKTTNLKSLTLAGIEQTRMLARSLEDDMGREPFEHLEELEMQSCGKIGLSNFEHIAKLKKLKRLTINHTTLYWDKEGVWENIKPLENVTTLDLANSFMPLKNSLASLLPFFPNVERLHADFMQRTNLADKVEMFKKCGSQFTEDIIANLEYVVFQHGTQIISEGAIGHEMYFLLSGKVDVVVKGKTIVTLPAGAFFGEIALLFDTPRTATIRANGTCEVYELSQHDMFRVLRMHPDSKVIIKNEARTRYEQLFGKKTNVKDKKEEEENNKETKPKKQPPSNDDLIQEIGTLYEGKLKSLCIKGKDLDFDLTAIFPKFPLLETFALDIESIQPIEKEMDMPEDVFLEHLKTVHFKLHDSHLTITPEGWKAFGRMAPRVKHLHVSEYVTSTSLLQMISDMKQLKILTVPNSPKCGRAIVQAIRQLPLEELTSNCKMKGDSFLKAVAKSPANLRIMDLTNSTFGDAQLKKIIMKFSNLLYVNVQTSGLTGIKPEQFKKNPKFAHVHINVNTTTSSKPALHRQSSKISPHRDRHNDSRSSMRHSESRMSLLSVRNSKSRSKSRPGSRTRKKVRAGGSRSTTPHERQNDQEESIIKKVDGMIANSVYPQVEALDYTLTFPHIEGEPDLKLVRFDVKPSKKFYVYRPKRDKGFVSYQRLTESNLMLDWETMQKKMMSHLDTNNDQESPIESPGLSKLFERAVVTTMEPSLSTIDFCNFSNVPPLPYTHVQRFALTKDIIPTYLINETKKVTCIYGMGGIGKTVLCIELANDVIVQKFFKDGVFWINLGEHVKPIVNYQHELLNLILKNNSLPIPPDYQRGISQLAHIIGGRKILIVLDDAWHVDQLRGFHVIASCPNVHILVNSRNQSLMSAFGPHVSYINKLPTLTLHETKSIISKWMDIDMTELPPFLIHYFKETNINNPLVLNLLCSILSSELDAASHNIKEREWRMILKDFDSTYIHSEIALQDYEKSGVLATVLINSIKALEKMNPKLVHLYKQLVVFEGYKEFSLGLLNILWGCNTNFSRMSIRQLSKHSLLEWHDDGDTANLHSIQTACLQYMLDDDFIANQHLKFVNAIEQEPDRDEYTKAYYCEQCCYHYLSANKKEPIHEHLTSIEFLINHMDYVPHSLKHLLDDYSNFFSKFYRLKHDNLAVPMNRLLSKPPQDVYTFYQMIQLSSRFVKSKLSLLQQLLARFSCALPKQSRVNKGDIAQHLPTTFSTDHETYMYKNAQKCIQYMDGHFCYPSFGKYTTEMPDNILFVDSMINHIYVSPLYRKLFVAQNTGDIIVYDVAKKDLLTSLQSHTDEVRHMIPVNDSLLASCSIDGSVRLWDMEHLKLFQTIQAPTQLFCLSIYYDDHLSPYLIFAGSTKGKTYIFNAAGKLINTVTTGANYISALHVLEDKLYVGSFDCSLRCIDLSNNDQQFSIETDKLLKLKYKIKSVTSVTLYDKQYLLIGCYQNIYLVDIHLFKIVHTYTNKKILEVKSLVVTKNYFYASSYGCIHQWSFPSEATLKEVNKRTLEPHSLYEFPHSRLITSISLYKSYLITGSFEESVQFIKKDTMTEINPADSDKQWWHRKHFMVESLNRAIPVVYKLSMSNIFVSKDDPHDIFAPLGGVERNLIGLKCLVNQETEHKNWILNYNQKQEEHFTLWDCFDTKKVKLMGFQASELPHQQLHTKHIIAKIHGNQLIVFLFQSTTMCRLIVNINDGTLINLQQNIIFHKKKQISTYQRPLWFGRDSFVILRGRKLVELYHYDQDDYKKPSFHFLIPSNMDINCVDCRGNYLCIGGDDRQLYVFEQKETGIEQIIALQMPHLILECQFGEGCIATTTLDRVIRCFAIKKNKLVETHHLAVEYLYNSLCWTSFRSKKATLLGQPVKRVYPTLFALSGTRNHMKIELLSTK